MNWIEITIQSTPETLEECTAKLTALGFDSFQIEDQRDIEAYSPYWEMVDEDLLKHFEGACRILLYLSETADSKDGIDLLRREFQVSGERVVKEEDWAENWKQYYKPLFIGENLVIHPEWEPFGDYTGKTVYISNPGMSFGTGLHSSTRLCLELLANQRLNGVNVLDIGCGSGILGVSSLLLGAEKAMLLDIDQLAADIASESAKKNSVSHKCTVLAGDFLTSEKLRKTVGLGYELVLSNIVADVLIALAPYMTKLVSPTGRWISSGIIDTRLNEVLDAVKAVGFRHIEVKEENGWAAILAHSLEK